MVYVSRGKFGVVCAVGLTLASLMFLARHAISVVEPKNRFEGEIRAFERADAKDPPPRQAIVFVGSSGIRLWKTLAEDFPNHRVINRGFGGSQIADSTYFADRILIPYQPKMIVLRAGTNDIHAGKSPERVAADLKAFVEKIRAALPETRLAFLSLNPSPARWANIERERRANELIQVYIATQTNMDFIDISTPMIGPDGLPRGELYIADRLHPNAAGYRLWTSIVAPRLPAE